MKRQRGQSVVEFALMAPMVCLLIFGGIYGGIMFIDYMNFSNEARTVARLVAVTPRTSRPDVITNYLENHNNGEFARFYTVTVTIETYKTDGTKVDADDLNAQDVLVTVDFNRDNTDLPLVVYLTGFPPEKFKLAYRMQLEQND